MKELTKEDLENFDNLLIRKKSIEGIRLLRKILNLSIGDAGYLVDARKVALNLL